MQAFEPNDEIADDDASDCTPPFQDDQDQSLDDEESNRLLRTNKSEDSASHDAPDVLIRKENKAVSIVRVVVFLVLVASAVGTSVFVFHFARDSEEESFEAEFEGVASRLVSGMTSDASLKMWLGRTLASGIAMSMRTSGATKTNHTMAQDLWDQMTQEARFNANVFFVSWSPLLNTEQERQDFEAFSKTQVFHTGSNPACYLCGNENRTYINPSDVAEIPGFGLASCGTLDVIGRKGVVPEENCGPVGYAVSSVCMCGDIPAGTVMPTNKVTIADRIFKASAEDGGFIPEEAGQAPYLPIWQATAVNPEKLPVMYNEMSETVRRRAILQMTASGSPILSEMFIRTGPYYDEYAGSAGTPGVVLYYPVFNKDNEIVGSVTMEILWRSFLSAVFPPLSDLVTLVVENSCNQNLTFNVDLSRDILTLVGEGDLHDRRFSNMVRSSTFEEYEQIVDLAAPVDKNQSNLDYCRYRFHVYATAKFEKTYLTNDPVLYAVIAGVIFVFTSFVFVFYDIIVRRRQSKVMGAAKRTNDIVSELFPREVRDRLYERAQENTQSPKKAAFSVQPTKTQMQNFLSDETPNSGMNSEPIADFFPHATVMFLDIEGFTAWSSEREPAQVFKLLETIYQSFDDAAKSLGVFKVETIGDSYVAVCGLPTPKEQHAAVMAQYAKVCLKRMLRLTRELEKFLGPSTGELRARVGLHSGPITAGVLRGEKARFQLFGDTVNTASRLESAGSPHKIHASRETADLLVASGKGSWVRPRKDLVHVKGKGDLQTYWIVPQTKGRLSSQASAKSTSTVDEGDQDIINHLTPGSLEAKSKNIQRKNIRLVDWNVEVLADLLAGLMASRKSDPEQRNSTTATASIQEAELDLKEKTKSMLVIDEMTHILSLPKFDQSQKQQESAVPPHVKEQLHDFVTQISNLYRDVPFHNFEHASHVIMSAGKLMRRVVNPDGVNFDTAGSEEAQEIHDRTYGICSDKLMQFSVVFSALIHDVDHTGLTNAELTKMGASVSTAYRNISVAEQNSVDVAWAVLMDERFKNLRDCIYTDEVELKRFRQLIVNAVMATDIADKQLKTLRESRWDDAFSESAPEVQPMEEASQVVADRKATIVFEYIIQASDVAHTMQHWHTYQKFNRRLFAERYVAWKNGHAGEKDPSHSWYGGELWFFDNYIIPLARKLDRCGVFGVSYDEYLNYAKENRKEWEQKGHGIVAEMLEDCRQNYDAEGALDETFQEEEEDVMV